MPPGQEGKITLAIPHTEGYSGEVSKSATVVTNDPKLANFSLMLRAYFKAAPRSGNETTALAAGPAGPFAVQPNSRWVTSTISGVSINDNIYLFNNDPAPVHIKQVLAGGDSFSVSLQTIEDGKRYQLSLATNPKLKPGRYQQTVRVLTDSASKPVAELYLEATVFARVFASPPAILMPALPLSSDLAAVTWPTVYVRKLRESGLKVGKVTTTLPFLKADASLVTEGQVYAIRLTIDPTKVKAGEYRGKILVEINEPGMPILEVAVQGSFN